MKKIIVFMCLIILILTVSFLQNSHAANTIIYGENVIEISAIDSDWTWNQVGSPYHGYHEGLKVTRIVFVPGAVSDDLSLLEESATGAELFPNYEVSVAVAQVLYFHEDGELMKPFLDYSASTLSTGAKVLIFIKR